MAPRTVDNALRCSFCHKDQHTVGKLVSSPSDFPRAYICDECIAVCDSILRDASGRPHTRLDELQGCIPALLNSICRWVAAGSDSEERLAEVRRIAERILVRPQLDAVLALPAGPELNTLIASKVFGKVGSEGSVSPDYSGDIAVAWRIVDVMATVLDAGSIANGSFHLKFAGHSDHGESHYESPCGTLVPDGGFLTSSWSAHFHFCYVERGLGAVRSHWGNLDKFCARGETPALAICRAALKAHW